MSDPIFGFVSIVCLNYKVVDFYCYRITSLIECYVAKDGDE